MIYITELKAFMAKQEFITRCRLATSHLTSFTITESYRAVGRRTFSIVYFRLLDLRAFRRPVSMVTNHLIGLAKSSSSSI